MFLKEFNMKKILTFLFLCFTVVLFSQQVDYNTKKCYVSEGDDVVSYFLNKKPIPAVSCLTILSLRCIKVERSKATFPVLMPCSSA